MQRPPTDESYRQRLRESIDIHGREFYTRVAIGTVVASLASTVLANTTEVTDGYPLQVEVGQEDPSIIKHQLPGKIEENPGKLAAETKQGPGFSIAVPQEFARDYTASQLGPEIIQSVDRYGTRIDRLLDDHKIKRVVVHVAGLASDESGKDGKVGDANLGEASDKNEELAVQRGELVAHVLQERFKDTPKVEIKNSESREATLKEDQIEQIDQIAEKHELTRPEIIRSYNDGSLQLNAADRAIFRRLFDNNRGARITSTLVTKEAPVIGVCDVVVQVTQQPGQVIAEKDPGRDGIDIAFIPFFVPPLPRRRKNTTSTAKKSRPVPPAKPSVSEESSNEPWYVTAADPVVSRLPQSRPPRPSARGYNPQTLFLGERLRKSRALKGLGGAALLGALVVFAPIIPAAVRTMDGKPTGLEGGPCITTTTDEGKKYEAFFKSPIHAVKSLLGKEKWSENQHGGTIYVQNDTRTTTWSAHNRIIVDKDGKVSSAQHIPGQMVKSYRYPTFKK